MQPLHRPCRSQIRICRSQVPTDSLTTNYRQHPCCYMRVMPVSSPEMFCARIQRYIYWNRRKRRGYYRIFLLLGRTFYDKISLKHAFPIPPKGSGHWGVGKKGSGHCRARRRPAAMNWWWAGGRLTATRENGLFCRELSVTLVPLTMPSNNDKRTFSSDNDTNLLGLANEIMKNVFPPLFRVQ